MYYSAGLLSKKDIYLEHKSSVLKSATGKSGREKKEKTDKISRKRKNKLKEENSKEVEAKNVTVKIEPGTSAVSLEVKDSDAISRLAIMNIKKEPIECYESADLSFESEVDEPDGLDLFGNVIETGSPVQSPSPAPSLSPSALTPSPNPSPKSRKKRDKLKKEKGEKKGKTKKEKGPPSIKALVAQRRKLWQSICKKEISKVSSEFQCTAFKTK
jgi:hypothetical protein